jgi:uncharacterized protein
MAGRDPEESIAATLVLQRWRDVAFLHWRVWPGDIADMLPEGLVPDVVDGSAWIGLTPFRVERERVLALPPMPGVSSYAETNVRTYVRHRDGRDGLWFFSVDVSSILDAFAARMALLPYNLASMSVTKAEGNVRYRCHRRIGPSAHHRIEIEPGAEVAPDELITALTGRWRAFTSVMGLLQEVAVDHEPWPLRVAEVRALDETMLEAAGLPAPTDPPMVHYSEGVDARLGLPRAWRPRCEARGAGNRTDVPS